MTTFMFRSPTKADLVRLEANLVAVQRSDAPLPLPFYQDLLMLIRWAAIAIAVLGGSSSASAQLAPLFMPGPMPTTVTITNKATGEKLGTATITGNRAVVRDAKGELVGTIVTENDGKRTFYDANGKVIEGGGGDLARELKP